MVFHSSPWLWEVIRTAKEQNGAVGLVCPDKVTFWWALCGWHTYKRHSQRHHRWVLSHLHWSDVGTKFIIQAKINGKSIYRLTQSLTLDRGNSEMTLFSNISGDQRVPAAIPEAEEQRPGLDLAHRPGCPWAVVKSSDATDSSFVRKNTLLFSTSNSHFPFSPSEGRKPASPCITDSHKSWQISAASQRVTIVFKTWVCTA